MVSESATTSTLSRSDAESSPLGAARVPHLFLAIECERPLALSECHSLEGLDELLIGRDSARGALRASDGGARTLALRVPDPRMSSLHARLTRVLDRWVLEDANSKNGVRLNGEVQRRAVLAPGDVFELGSTFFHFDERSAVAGPSAGVGERGARTFLPELAAAHQALAQVAASTVPVIIQGETGTGKELAARAVHELSGRTGPFVAINCGALPEALVESELFGHRKGAFTGATEDRPGLIRTASGGTLFLDEIGDLPAPLQAAFLRVLQEGEVLPLGGTQPVRIDLRVVAATHRDLEALVEAQQFRADLYARLSGFQLTLPPLRERRCDLGLLIQALLPRVVPAGQAERLTLSADATRALFAYDWPLNVRELEKALGVAAVLAQGGRIELAHLPEPVRAAATRPLHRAIEPSAREQRPITPLEAQRREHLVSLLRTHHGNVSAVARAMGLARMQIQRWLKRYRLDPQSFRGPGPAQ